MSEENTQETPVEQETTVVETTNEVAQEAVTAAASVAEETPAAAPVTETVAAAIAAAPVVVEAVSTVTVELSPFQKKMAEIIEKGTPEQSGLIARLNTYLEDMKPGKPMSGDHGVTKQYQLWRTIFNTIEHAPAAQFKSLWSILLAFFHEHADGVFHESYVFRFSEFWKHSKQELDGFQRILNLIKVSADPKTRGETAKQVDLDKTLSQPFTEEGRNRLLGFYKK
jgi:hypothetical protein